MNHQLRGDFWNYADLGMNQVAPDDVVHSVCDPQLPEAGKVWEDVIDQADLWLDDLKEAV